jgi:type IV secretion system protein VirD4
MSGNIATKIKKYAAPNLPYAFIGWGFLKLGTAFRMADGANVGQRLVDMVQHIAPAFSNITPSLNPFDWLVGIAGAVLVRLYINGRTKKAKKFRRDMEYGTARWGNAADIKPFINPKFKENVILTGTEFLTMNTRPANPANARNLNCCIIGSSGSGKTRFWLTPNLLQASSPHCGWVTTATPRKPITP